MLTYSYGDQLDIDQLVETLKTDKVTKTLVLSQNSIGDDGLRLLVEGLKENDTLVSLTIEDNEVTSDGIPFLVEYLESNTTLCKLDLSYNYIEDAGVSLLARAVLTNTTLQCLCLTHCDLSDDGVIELASKLAIHKTITELDVGYNERVSDASIRAIVNTLHFLEVLCIEECDDVTDDGVIFFLKSLETNTTLKKLYIGACVENCMDVVINVILVNTTIECISIQPLNFSMVYWPKLIEALKVNATLLELELGYYMDEYSDRIDDLLNRNKTWASGEVDTKPARSA